MFHSNFEEIDDAVFEKSKILKSYRRTLYDSTIWIATGYLSDSCKIKIKHLKIYEPWSEFNITLDTCLSSFLLNL